MLLSRLLVNEVMLCEFSVKRGNRAVSQINHQIDILSHLLHPVQRTGQRTSKIVWHPLFMKDGYRRRQRGEKINGLNMPTRILLQYCLCDLSYSSAVTTGDKVESRLVFFGSWVALKPRVDT